MMLRFVCGVVIAIKIMGPIFVSETVNSHRHVVTYMATPFLESLCDFEETYRFFSTIIQKLTLQTSFSAFFKCGE
jgi:hypothetical protein